MREQQYDFGAYLDPILQKPLARLRKEKSEFGRVLEKFRQKYDVADADIDPDEIFRDVRDKSPGREVIL